MVKMSFRISGMHCSSCAMRLDGIEDLLPGIIKIATSYRNQRMDVEYDETLVSEAQIIAAVKQQGYEALPV